MSGWKISRPDIRYKQEKNIIIQKPEVLHFPAYKHSQRAFVHCSHLYGYENRFSQLLNNLSLSFINTPGRNIPSDAGQRINICAAPNDCSGI